MLIYVRVAYVNLIATGIVFNIRASGSHIGRMVAFSEHRRWIISVFDRRSIMNRLYWHDQQVGYVCFVPFVWEQRGVIAAVADQTAMISHLLPMCWATRGRSWGHVMMWARFGSQGSIALNWHSRYSGTRYSGTWLYIDVTLSIVDMDFLYQFNLMLIALLFSFFSMFEKKMFFKIFKSWQVCDRLT